MLLQLKLQLHVSDFLIISDLNIVKFRIKKQQPVLIAGWEKTLFLERTINYVGFKEF